MIKMLRLQAVLSLSVSALTLITNMFLKKSLLFSLQWRFKHVLNVLGFFSSSMLATDVFSIHLSIYHSREHKNLKHLEEFSAHLAQIQYNLGPSEILNIAFFP